MGSVINVDTEAVSGSTFKTQPSGLLQGRARQHPEGYAKLPSSSIDGVSQYYKKVIKPTEEEINLHKKFLKEKLKKNYFS